MAASRARVNAGSSMPISTAMTPITTSNSTSVNPQRRRTTDARIHASRWLRTYVKPKESEIQGLETGGKTDIQPGKSVELLHRRFEHRQHVGFYLVGRESVQPQIATLRRRRQDALGREMHEAANEREGLFQLPGVFVVR